MQRSLAFRRPNGEDAAALFGVEAAQRRGCSSAHVRPAMASTTAHAAKITQAGQRLFPRGQKPAGPNRTPQPREFSRRSTTAPSTPPAMTMHRDRIQPRRLEKACDGGNSDPLAGSPSRRGISRAVGRSKPTSRSRGRSDLPKATMKPATPPSMPTIRQKPGVRGAPRCWPKADQ